MNGLIESLKGDPLFLLCSGAILGWVLKTAWDWSCEALREPPSSGIRIMIQTTLDATQPIKITVIGRDAENNPVDLSGQELKLTAEATNDKNFGELNDEQDTFNPGEAGATGIIRGTVTIDGEEHVAETAIELVAGAPVTLELEFTKKEAEAPSE